MRTFIRQYEYNVRKGPLHEGSESLPTSSPTATPVRFIAFYLPQFHPIPENDEWWGPGFTEWTNVTKALPRYLGHLQPRLPADLGFYDLRRIEVLRQQADLARRAGVYGFCIHNYWFSGRQVLETPLRLLLDNPDIDLPFCLDWANENWTRRWDGLEGQVLLRQRYEPADDAGYIDSIMPALRDRRYIRIEGRPLIMVYRPKMIPHPANMMQRWRSVLMERGLGNPYLVMAQTFEDYDPRPYGFDASAGFPPHNGAFDTPNKSKSLRMLDHQSLGSFAGSYEDMAKRMLENRGQDYLLFPGVCPGWDNEARMPRRGFSFFGSTPAEYGRWLRAASDRVLDEHSPEERIVFINAWNEWAEGAVLEPDQHFGYAYLAETRRVLDSLAGVAPMPRPKGTADNGAERTAPKPSPVNYLQNGPRLLYRKIKRGLARA